MSCFVRTDIFTDNIPIDIVYIRTDIYSKDNHNNTPICPCRQRGYMANDIKDSAPYGKVTTADDVGRIIRAKRKEIGVRQDMAAGMSGVGTKFLSQLENGKETAELGKALYVLKKLGLNIYIYPRSADPIKG